MALAPKKIPENARTRTTLNRSGKIRHAVVAKIRPARITNTTPTTSATVPCRMAGGASGRIGAGAGGVSSCIDAGAGGASSCIDAGAPLSGSTQPTGTYAAALQEAGADRISSAAGRGYSCTKSGTLSHAFSGLHAASARAAASSRFSSSIFLFFCPFSTASTMIAASSANGSAKYNKNRITIVIPILLFCHLSFVSFCPHYTAFSPPRAEVMRNKRP